MSHYNRNESDPYGNVGYSSSVPPSRIKRTSVASKEDNEKAGSIISKFCDRFTQGVVNYLRASQKSLHTTLNVIDPERDHPGMTSEDVKIVNQAFRKFLFRVRDFILGVIRHSENMFQDHVNNHYFYSCLRDVQKNNVIERLRKLKDPSSLITPPELFESLLNTLGFEYETGMSLQRFDFEKLDWKYIRWSTRETQQIRIKTELRLFLEHYTILSDMLQVTENLRFDHGRQFYRLKAHTDLFPPHFYQSKREGAELDTLRRELRMMNMAVSQELKEEEEEKRYADFVKEKKKHDAEVVQKKRGRTTSNQYDPRYENNTVIPDQKRVFRQDDLDHKVATDQKDHHVSHHPNPNESKQSRPVIDWNSIEFKLPSSSSSSLTGKMTYIDRSIKEGERRDYRFVDEWNNSDYHYSPSNFDSNSNNDYD